jgi:hypothetical protein
VDILTSPRCTFVVIDFEALTPAGRPTEPTEVAAMALVVRDDNLVEEGWGRNTSETCHVLVSPLVEAAVGCLDRDGAFSILTLSWSDEGSGRPGRVR